MRVTAFQHPLRELHADIGSDLRQRAAQHLELVTEAPIFFSHCARVR